MRRLVFTWLIAATTSLGLATPGMAQYFSGWPYWNNDYNYGWPANPNNPNFDPAAAAINALNNSFPRYSGPSSPIDFTLIDQIEAGNYSAFRGHSARCHARFVTYSARTNSYIGNDGMPHRCKL